MEDQWKIWYWTRAFKGRAEFPRLLLEAAGARYTVMDDAATCANNSDLRSAEPGEELPFPAACPPMVTGPNGFCCSNTPAIMSSLGKALKLYPNEGLDEVHAMQVNCTVADIVAEGRLAFHAKDPIGSYASQKEETQPRIEWFSQERLPKWLAHLERVLARGVDQGSTFFFSGRMTYADVVVFQCLQASEAQFPQAYAAMNHIPLLKAFQQRMKRIPNIAAYLASERCPPFAGDSMM